MCNYSPDIQQWTKIEDLKKRMLINDDAHKHKTFTVQKLKALALIIEKVKPT